MPADERRELAKYCSQHLYDAEAFEKLCNAVRPMAYAVMKLQKNVIPYYDNDDYLQEAYLTVYRVLKRLAVKPEIIDSFSAYLWTSIKNTYCGLFRDYVLHHLVEIRSYEARENGLTYSQMVFFQTYADSYYARIGSRLVQAFQFVHSVEIISMVILERAKFMVQEWFKNWFEPLGGEDGDGK